MSRLVVVSNRVAIPRGGRAIPGGLAVAVQTALREHGGLWFGWSGEVSQVHRSRPSTTSLSEVTYATIDLLEQEYDDYYNGFCNGVIWPLFHYLPQYMNFRRRYSESYMRVNERFARTLARLVKPDDLIWVHDYHLIALAQKLREAGLRNRIGFFLHIPFPAHGLLRSLPGYRNLLGSLCAYDLIGFQTDDDLRAFLYCMFREFDVSTDDKGVLDIAGQRVCVDHFPVGIDVRAISRAARQSLGTDIHRRLVASMNARTLVTGVDRLDYSKGLWNRLHAYERLLEQYPEHHGHVVLLQIAPPSRKDVRAYENIRQELEGAAGRINGRFADFDWVPIRYLNRGFSRRSLMGILRVAQVALITPLRDGMNLVAKEYVAAQDPSDPGVLVLSSLAGAARELEAAILVNPFDLDDIAAGMQKAISMPSAERRDRHQEMLQVLRRNDIQVWRAAFLERLEDAPY